MKGHGNQNEIEIARIDADDEAALPAAGFQVSAEAQCPLELVAGVLGRGNDLSLGQAIQNMYIHFFGFTEKTASNPTVATLIFLSVLLTGLGVYDNIGQYAGAGSAVPVTGFANSIASAAIEHRSEGLVLGVGGNMFKLAGSVIVFGVVAAFVAGVIKACITCSFDGRAVCVKQSTTETREPPDLALRPERPPAKLGGRSRAEGRRRATGLLV